MQESRDKKMEELFELTVNNYKQPTTLPLRTYNLTTTSPGASKEEERSTKGQGGRKQSPPNRCRRGRLVDVDDVDLEVTEETFK